MRQSAETRLSIAKLVITALVVECCGAQCCYAQCHYAECLCSVSMLSVIMLTVMKMSGIVLKLVALPRRLEHAQASSILCLCSIVLFFWLFLSFCLSFFLSFFMSFFLPPFSLFYFPSFFFLFLLYLCLSFFVSIFLSFPSFYLSHFCSLFYDETLQFFLSLGQINISQYLLQFATRWHHVLMLCRECFSYWVFVLNWLFFNSIPFYKINSNYWIKKLIQ